MNDGVYEDYDSFAGAYDRHWGFFADGVRPVLDRLVLDSLDDGAHVVDLCCGTGVLARSLTDRFRVTGIDGSSAMIEFARQNAPDAHFFVADARDFATDDPAAVVVSTFDSLNHVMSVDELTEVFRRVSEALAPDGRFVFDLNMEEGFQQRWSDVTIVDERDVIVGRPKWDESTRIATLNFTIVERTPDGSLWRSEVTLTQRCYSESEVVDALGTAGFSDIAILDGPVDLDFGGVGRSFFVAR